MGVLGALANLEQCRPFRVNQYEFPGILESACGDRRLMRAMVLGVMAQFLVSATDKFEKCQHCATADTVKTFAFCVAIPDLASLATDPKYICCADCMLKNRKCIWKLEGGKIGQMRANSEQAGGMWRTKVRVSAGGMFSDM
jgi:hypothetical protein